jgi:hypothetical protein
MPGKGYRAEILGDSVSCPEAAPRRESDLPGKAVQAAQAVPPGGQIPVPPSGPRKNLVTEAEAKRLVSRCGGTLSLARGTIITPAAKDVFSYAGCSVEFV